MIGSAYNITLTIIGYRLNSNSEQGCWYFNTIAKGMNPTILPPAIGKYSKTDEAL